MTDPRSDHAPDAGATCIVGAGLAGLVCARRLHEAGHPVVVLEKSRGSGGRLSTRRDDDLQFDHGAQYFTVSDERFEAQAADWVMRGVAAVWDVRPAVLDHGRTGSTHGEMTRYVGTPGMSALTGDLARGLDVRFDTRVTKLERAGEEWTVLTESGELGRFRRVLLTLPAPQAVAFLEPAPDLQASVERIRVAPTWSVMMRVDGDLHLPYDAAFIKNSPLSWVARDGSKPGRTEPGAWVLQATPDWSQEHLDDPPNRVAAALCDAFFEATGVQPVDPTHLVPHRWRFAFPENDVGEYCLWDASVGLGLAGDWCLPGARIEGAFLSGWHLAESLIG